MPGLPSAALSTHCQPVHRAIMLADHGTMLYAAG